MNRIDRIANKMTATIGVRDVRELVDRSSISAVLLALGAVAYDKMDKAKAKKVGMMLSQVARMVEGTEDF